MRHKKSAQTVTEYLALVTMLGLALALGWDFISGGFQGGVKNLTQSVDIATQDIIRQGDPPPQLPYCNCDDDLNNWACGVEPLVPIPATINCNQRQRYKRQLCTGTLCTQPQIEWCEWDPTCCIWLGPDPSGGVDHCWDDYCPQPTLGPQGWGNGRFLRQCGSGAPFHQCQTDNPTCNFSCDWNTLTQATIGQPKDPNAIECTNANTNVPNNAMGWVLVDGPGQCGSVQGGKCTSYCDTAGGWVRSGNTCIQCPQSRSNWVRECTCAGSGGAGSEPCGAVPGGPCCHETIFNEVPVWCPIGTAALEGYCRVYPAWNNWGPGNYNPRGGHIISRGSGPTYQEGWQCNATAGTTGGSCQHHLIYTVANCGAPNPACLNRPSLFCESLPSEFNQAYYPCQGPQGQDYNSKYTNTFMQWCEGNCTAPDARATICCNQPNTYGCMVVTTASHIRSGAGQGQPLPMPNCPGGKTEWFQMTSRGQWVADPPQTAWNHDFHAKFCCDTPPTGQCTAISKTACLGGCLNDVRWDFPRCQSLGPGWYELMGYCTGNCNQDDAKITICCRP